MPSPEAPVHSWASLGQSLVGSLLLSPGSWCAQGSVCALQESVSPVLCKLWWFYGGANGDLLQEGSCHTHVCCTQSPCPCGSPLLAHLSTGDAEMLRSFNGPEPGGPESTIRKERRERGWYSLVYTESQESPWHGACSVHGGLRRPFDGVKAQSAFSRGS